MVVEEERSPEQTVDNPHPTVGKWTFFNRWLVFSSVFAIIP